MAFQGSFWAISLLIFLANFLSMIEFSKAANAKVPSHTISNPFNRTIFSPDFLFGASTSSYQVIFSFRSDPFHIICLLSMLFIRFFEEIINKTSNGGFLLLGTLGYLYFWKELSLRIKWVKFNNCVSILYIDKYIFEVICTRWREIGNNVFHLSN